MPLFHTRELDSHTLLGIWTLEEEPEELLHTLPPHFDAQQALAHTHPRRQREWLASRVLVYQLLQRFTAEPLPLLRDLTGKPLLQKEGLHLSITHSPSLAAVILSDRYEVGIDIEYISPKALRVADKFLTERERILTADDELKTCLYWSAKETLYKMYGKKQLVFKENLFVEPAQGAENNVLQGQVITDKFSKLYQIQHELLLGHVLTYSIDK
ncbi:4'-phosphopantetheinyl transferase family protein [Pontibacter roseus]|uniref:4'-phosphopantetheinyl transferase family protein n=1 Tax=Pontibacter roseus TaxID=336989 RepID=UPI00035D16DD|nr:4'-phosphopantetheinyl transferase superfamily protein [Pontibacter roseus]